jgi:GAF domain-containing protein
LVDQAKDLQQCLGYQPWMHDHNFSGSRTIIKRCIAQQKALAIGNILDEPELAGQYSVIRNNIQAALCVPIKLDHHLTGVLYADNTVDRQYFTQTDVQFVESFANILSLRLLFQSIEHNIKLVVNS